MKSSPTVVHCPFCGHEQKESKSWIATLCRGCGQHFARQSPKPTRESSAVEVSEQVPLRDISCHRCGAITPVSPLALNCACSGCSTSISLQKITIAGQVSRWIDTREALWVLRGASLFAPLAICREAVILGKVAGVLLVEETCRVEARGLQPVQLKAGSFLLERGAEVDFPFPVQADEITVRGHLRGDLYCSGRVTIARRGVVHGKVFARSIQMERGGDLVGPLRIGPVDPPALHIPGYLDATEQLHPQIPPPRRKRISVL